MEFHFWLLLFFSVLIPSLWDSCPWWSGSAHIPLVRSLASDDIPRCHRSSGVNWSQAVSLATSLSPRDVAREQGFPNYNAWAHIGHTVCSADHSCHAGQPASPGSAWGWGWGSSPGYRGGFLQHQAISQGRLVRLIRREMLAVGTDPRSHMGMLSAAGRALASKCRWVKFVLYASGISLSPTLKTVKKQGSAYFSRHSSQWCSWDPWDWERTFGNGNA